MKSNTKYTVVYLPPETTKCPKCDGVDFVPFVKSDVEYAKCVKCGCLIEATHYEHEVACDDGACEINPPESSRQHVKKK